MEDSKEFLFMWVMSIKNNQLEIKPGHLRNIYQFILYDINKSITG